MNCRRLSSRTPRRAAERWSRALVAACAAALASEAGAADLASVVAKAREQVERGAYAEGLVTLATLESQGPLPKALAIDAALLETVASLVAKGEAAGQAACAKAVRAAEFDPNVAREQSPKVRAVCKLAADAERSGRLAKEGVTVGALAVAAPEVAGAPVRVSTTASSVPSWLRVVARLESSALAGSYDLALAPADDGLRGTLDPTWAKPGATLTISLVAQDAFGDLARLGEPARVVVPVAEAMLALGVLPAGATVSVDGAVAQPNAGRVVVTPGAHQVSLLLADGASASATIDAPRGLVTSVSLSPQRAGGGRPYAWAIAGTSLAAGVAGVVLFVSADSRRREIEEAAALREPGSLLPATDYATLRSKDQERDAFVTAGAALAIGAGVGAVVATVLFLVPEPGRATTARALAPPLRPFVTPLAVPMAGAPAWQGAVLGLTGRF